MNRRGFLASILAAGVAPAVIGSGILMPVRKLWTPPDAGVITAASADGWKWSEDGVVWMPRQPKIDGAMLYFDAGHWQGPSYPITLGKDGPTAYMMGVESPDLPIQITFGE